MAYYGDNSPFAWVSMNSHNTASIQQSFNISSVSRIQNGTHQINFTSGPGNSNYCPVGENGCTRDTWADGDDGNDQIQIVLNRNNTYYRIGGCDLDDGLQGDAKFIFSACYSTNT
tara:strand:- start:512 stop:856 length:345 start_codon:yes stop_codon:yes gene_type:complete